MLLWKLHERTVRCHNLAKVSWDQLNKTQSWFQRALPPMSSFERKIRVNPACVTSKHMHFSASLSHNIRGCMSQITKSFFSGRLIHKSTQRTEALNEGWWFLVYTLNISVQFIFDKNQHCIKVLRFWLLRHRFKKKGQRITTDQLQNSNSKLYTGEKMHRMQDRHWPLQQVTLPIVYSHCSSKSCEPKPRS